MENKFTKYIDKYNSQLKININYNHLVLIVCEDNESSFFSLEPIDRDIDKAERMVSVINEWIKRFKNRAFE